MGADPDPGVVGPKLKFHPFAYHPDDNGDYTDVLQSTQPFWSFAEGENSTQRKSTVPKMSSLKTRLSNFLGETVMLAPTSVLRISQKPPGKRGCIRVKAPVMKQIQSAGYLLR